MSGRVAYRTVGAAGAVLVLVAAALGGLSCSLVLDTDALNSWRPLDGKAEQIHADGVPDGPAPDAAPTEGNLPDQAIDHEAVDQTVIDQTVIDQTVADHEVIDQSTTD